MTPWIITWAIIGLIAFSLIGIAFVVVGMGMDLRDARRASEEGEV